MYVGIAAIRHNIQGYADITLLTQSARSLQILIDKLSIKIEALCLR